MKVNATSKATINVATIPICRISPPKYSYVRLFPGVVVVTGALLGVLVCFGRVTLALFTGGMTSSESLSNVDSLLESTTCVLPFRRLFLS